MPPTVSDDRAAREDLEHRREAGQLRDLIQQYRDGFGIERPAQPDEPWLGSPRRPGLPIVTGHDLDELGANLRAAAEVAALRHTLALEREFPGWRVWRCSEALWWATRHQRPTPQMQDCGLHCITGGVRQYTHLQALLTEQTRLQTWAEQHHWQIPGDKARKELGLPPEPPGYRPARM